MDDKLKSQFSIRSADFDVSANWISDAGLIRAHVDLAGPAKGKALDLCCGTGQVGRALKAAGWDVQGLDICHDMAGISSRFFPVREGKAEKMPFESGFFNAVVCRQAFQFLQARDALSEIRRALAPGGVFVLSLTVPFSEEDWPWLGEIHRIKQALLLKFYTADELAAEVSRAGFHVREKKVLKVRESITRWMAHAPELSEETRHNVIAAVEGAPPEYKKWHHVETRDGEVFEDWNWIVFKAVL
jgi:SAM-dependent methyltransferase